MNRICLALLASLIAICGYEYALADSGPEMIPEDYAAPATMVELPGHRSLNMRCTGKGERVVVFEAGANADSSTWYRVIPLLAGKARVCAYDRAGYGFSDVGPMPRDLDADIADLHELIRAARISLPLVLVGHSLGSNIVRRYVQKFPGEIDGIVLVDPPTQGEDELMSEQWRQEDVAMREKRDTILTACLSSADTGQLMPGCLRAPPSWMGERVAAAVTANKSKTGYWLTLRSELGANQAIFSAPVSSDERYGDIPLILLSADAPAEDLPDDVRAALAQARAQTQQRILAGTSHGKQIDVSGASHDIQIERPEAVASAVMELLQSAPR